MAKADKKHMALGGREKGAGEGAMTDFRPEDVGENQILSNRDKALHTKERGLDSKRVESEQHNDE